MPNRDQEFRETINDFKGRFDRLFIPRGPGDNPAAVELGITVPPGFAEDELNLIYHEGCCSSRPGSILLLNGVCNIAGNLRRIFYFRLNDNVDRYLTLEYDSGTNSGVLNLYIPGSGFFILLTLAGMSDFSAIVMFDRVYVTPHDRVRGVINAAVYVLVTIAPLEFRKAAGLQATDTPLTFAAATSATAGTVEIGVRILSYCFETTSGFRTKGIADPIVYNTATASRKIDLTNYDVGPTGTAKRVFLASKLIPNFDPLKAKTYELFFIPNGIIADNTTITPFTVDFFDAQLVDSADYLNEQLAEIPAGVAITDYHSRLVVGGIHQSTLINGTASPSNPGTARISKVRDPESFSTVDGFKGIDPNFGGGIKNQKELGGNLYIAKTARFYALSDNGAEPSSWPFTLIDSGKGAECYSLGMILGQPGETSGVIFLGAKDGLYLFNGIINDIPLSYNIQGLWESIVQNETVICDFSLTKIKVDPFAKRIYITFQSDDSGTRVITTLVGDYKQGLNPQNVRWSLWQWGDNSVGMQPIDIELGPPLSGSTGRLFLARTASATISLLTNVIGKDANGISQVAYRSFYKSRLIDPDGSGATWHWAAFRFRAMAYRSNFRVRIYDDRANGGTLLKVFPDDAETQLYTHGNDWIRQITDIEARGIRFEIEPFHLTLQPEMVLYSIVIDASFQQEADQQPNLT